MMLNLNHKLLKNVDVEMIGQSGIQIELNSWVKYEIIGPVVQTPKDVMLVKYKWVFVRKRNKKNKVQNATYGTRFFAETWYRLWKNAPVMDAIIFRSLISLIIIENLDMLISIWIIG